MTTSRQTPEENQDYLDALRTLADLSGRSPR